MIVQVSNTHIYSKPENYRLKFVSGVACPVFTGKKIKGEASGGSELIDVILVDSHNKIINDGPLASKRVRIVLLPGCFDDIWTSLQFENNIITDWKNKKNILQGDLSFNLEHGRGTVGKIWIKHDKNHLSKSKFRLGAMVDDGSFEIKEAITNPFEAKDRRIELNSKNGPLNLDDKVSRLKNIGKKGSICKRLENEKIMTVKDFLDKLSSNPLALQKIYGSNGKRWEVTVRHAKTSISSIKPNVSESVHSTSQEWDDELLVDYNGCVELDGESNEPSDLSFNQFLYNHDEVFLFTNLEPFFGTMGEVGP
ncbi:putative CALMODULIN-BINDING PROTEIN60 [Helianthus annuus]|nr:putative CALMODULIN-BINDING PROTEIN60 [Helianthus annuus]